MLLDKLFCFLVVVDSCVLAPMDASSSVVTLRFGRPGLRRCCLLLRLLDEDRVLPVVDLFDEMELDLLNLLPGGPEDRGREVLLLRRLLLIGLSFFSSSTCALLLDKLREKERIILILLPR